MFAIAAGLIVAWGVLEATYRLGMREGRRRACEMPPPPPPARNVTMDAIDAVHALCRGQALTEDQAAALNERFQPVR